MFFVVDVQLPHVFLLSFTLIAAASVSGFILMKNSHPILSCMPLSCLVLYSVVISCCCVFVVFLVRCWWSRGELCFVGVTRVAGWLSQVMCVHYYEEWWADVCTCMCEGAGLQETEVLLGEMHVDEWMMIISLSSSWP